MGFSIKRFSKDEKKSVGGVWVDYESFKVVSLDEACSQESQDRLFVLVASSGNIKAKNLTQRLIEPEMQRLRKDRLPMNELEAINRKVVASCILLNWKNLTDEKGSPISYSEEKALELLTQNPDFLTDVVAISELRANYEADQEASSKGN